MNPISFTSVSINPTILEEERQFKLSQRGGLQTMSVNSEEKEEEEEEGSDDEMEDYRSVILFDLIAENTDFVSLE